MPISLYSTTPQPAHFEVRGYGVGTPDGFYILRINDCYVLGGGLRNCDVLNAVLTVLHYRSRDRELDPLREVYLRLLRDKDAVDHVPNFGFGGPDLFLTPLSRSNALTPYFVRAPEGLVCPSADTAERDVPWNQIPLGWRILFTSALRSEKWHPTRKTPPLLMLHTRTTRSSGSGYVRTSRYLTDGKVWSEGVFELETVDRVEVRHRLQEAREQPLPGLFLAERVRACQDTPQAFLSLFVPSVFLHYLATSDTLYPHRDRDAAALSYVPPELDDWNYAKARPFSRILGWLKRFSPHSLGGEGDVVTHWIKALRHDVCRETHRTFDWSDRYRDLGGLYARNGALRMARPNLPRPIRLPDIVSTLDWVASLFPQLMEHGATIGAALDIWRHLRHEGLWDQPLFLAWSCLRVLMLMLRGKEAAREWTELAPPPPLEGRAHAHSFVPSGLPPDLENRMLVEAGSHQTRFPERDGNLGPHSKQDSPAHRAEQRFIIDISKR